MDSCAGSRLRPTAAVAGRGVPIYNIGIAVSDATHRLTDMCLAEYMLRDALRESLCVRLGIIETYVDRKRDAAGQEPLDVVFGHDAVDSACEAVRDSGIAFFDAVQGSGIGQADHACQSGGRDVLFFENKRNALPAVLLFGYDVHGGKCCGDIRLLDIVNNITNRKCGVDQFYYKAALVKPNSIKQYPTPRCMYQKAYTTTSVECLYRLS